MAQDLGVMLQQVWLLLKDSPLEADRKLTAELAEAAKNLHASRLRHFGHFPMVCAPTALANKLTDELKRLPDGNDFSHWNPANAYYQALHDFDFLKNALMTMQQVLQAALDREESERQTLASGETCRHEHLECRRHGLAGHTEVLVQSIVAGLIAVIPQRGCHFVAHVIGQEHPSDRSCPKGGEVLEVMDEGIAGQ